MPPCAHDDGLQERVAADGSIELVCDLCGWRKGDPEPAAEGKRASVQSVQTCFSDPFADEGCQHEDGFRDGGVDENGVKYMVCDTCGYRDVVEVLHEQSQRKQRRTTFFNIGTGPEAEPAPGADDDGSPAYYSMASDGSTYGDERLEKMSRAVKWMQRSFHRWSLLQTLVSEWQRAVLKEVMERRVRAATEEATRQRPPASAVGNGEKASLMSPGLAGVNGGSGSNLASLMPASEKGLELLGAELAHIQTELQELETELWQMAK
eukprot:TRINITY_DN114086_c0_g1_i1.p1 TRINITY_DN114086_c0_g1~~TRINITY_DN114086_c0_g1_i1.p1  ORF type:complete len:264 (+),score=62.19 TRINITY_DN114086_c0_g1_i1:85-876(+)